VNFKKKGFQPPPIPHDPATHSKDKDSKDFSVFKLCTMPTDKDSQTYDMKVLTFKCGSIEQFLLWQKDLNKVIVRQNVQSAPGKYAMTRCLLDGDALTAQETDDHYVKCMHSLAVHVFPKNALMIQRQWFHQYLHKRIEDSMREFVARVNEINEMMEHFPPALNKDQMISNTEMKDLLEFAIPTIWRVKMAEHAFRSIDHEIPDIVEFCERLEYTEMAQQMSTLRGDSNTIPTPSQSHKEKNSKRGQHSRDKLDALTHAMFTRTKNHKRPGKVMSYKDSDGSDGCHLHIWATDHTTAECRVI
jgi:hypothetical protein